MECSVYDPHLVVGHLEGVLVDDSAQDLVEALLGVRQHLLVEQPPELVDDVQSEQTYEPSGLENVKQEYRLGVSSFFALKDERDAALEERRSFRIRLSKMHDESGLIIKSTRLRYYLSIQVKTIILSIRLIEL